MAAPDRERLSLDVSMLKQQYSRLRERQRQAHIILTAACGGRPSLAPPLSAPAVAMNHLLLGKPALRSKGRRLPPPPGAVPPPPLPAPKAATPSEYHLLKMCHMPHLNRLDVDPQNRALE